MRSVRGRFAHRSVHQAIEQNIKTACSRFAIINKESENIRQCLDSKLETRSRDVTCGIKMQTSYSKACDLRHEFNKYVSLKEKGNFILPGFAVVGGTSEDF